MPGKSNVAKEKDLVYVYDGSWPGFFCCVYASVYGREIPLAIYPEAEAQPTMFDLRYIETEHAKAAKVKASIPEKICPRALELVENVFLSCMEQKELAMLRFLLLGYKQGSKTPWMMGHPEVSPLLKAEQHRSGEVHLLKGFIRFSDYDGVLGATISPKNFVLNDLAPHFVGRYSEERFMIFDKTNKAALIYDRNNEKNTPINEAKNSVKIIPLDTMEFPAVDDKEEQYRALWKKFYKTVAIEARRNEKCRRTHMPKRYWAHMTEMQEYL